MADTSDDNIILPEQLRAARMLLGLSQQELAELAGISVITLKRAEGSSPGEVARHTLFRLEQSLESRGIRFIWPSENGGAGARFSRNAARIRLS